MGPADQQQVANDLVLTIGYLGNKSQNLRSNVQNINNIPQSDFALGDQLSQPLVGNTAGVNPPFAGYTTLWGSGVQVQQALRPFPQYDFIDTGCCLQNVGMSSYEALLVSLERRFQNGLQFQISYTWSKTLTDADSLLPNNGNTVIQVQNVNDLRQEKAISTQDIPQNFVASELYELPFGKGKPFLNQGPINYVVGGWEVGAYSATFPVNRSRSVHRAGFRASRILSGSAATGPPLMKARLPEAARSIHSTFQLTEPILRSTPCSICLPTVRPPLTSQAMRRLSIRIWSSIETEARSHWAMFRV